MCRMRFAISALMASPKSFRQRLTHSRHKLYGFSVIMHHVRGLVFLFSFMAMESEVYSQSYDRHSTLFGTALSSVSNGTCGVGLGFDPHSI